MSDAYWYRGWKGDKYCLPRSEHVLAQQKLIPIQAQIAVFFGNKDGTLESLQNGIMKLHQREPIYCESCGRSIWVERHKNDCEISLAYTDVMTNKPTPIKLND